jgi:hypothetical protein
VAKKPHFIAPTPGKREKTRLGEREGEKERGKREREREREERERERVA